MINIGIWGVWDIKDENCKDPNFIEDNSAELESSGGNEPVMELIDDSDMNQVAEDLPVEDA